MCVREDGERISRQNRRGRGTHCGDRCTQAVDITGITIDKVDAWGIVEQEIQSLRVQLIQPCARKSHAFLEIRRDVLRVGRLIEGIGLRLTIGPGQINLANQRQNPVVSS